MPASPHPTHEEVTVEFVADGLDPVIGLTLDGRFRVVAQVGKGAMGTVYKAVQEPLNRTVALKVLDSNYGAGRDETFRQRFLVEAALTAKLSHPNTVRIIDYGCTKDGLFYLAMEYLAGSTLDRVLQVQGALSWRRVASIAMQIARALREAHGLGVVHRDLKPANIMVLNADNDADHVKVLDFGLVKSFIEGHELEGRAITQHGMLMGSPPYMAPEQGDKNRADPRSDIYSLGIMMFEALTGRPPFTGNAPLEIILKHVNQAVPPLRAPNDREPIPEAMVALVNKCLAKSPMDRFDSMEELIAGLTTLTSSPAVTPATEMPMLMNEHDFVDVAPRHRTGWLVLGFLAALIIGITGTALVMKSASPVQGERVVSAVQTGPSPELPVEPKAPPPPPPKEPVHVMPVPFQLRITSVPSGALVEGVGTSIKGTTPLEQSLQVSDFQQLEVMVSRAGYKPQTVRFGGGKDLDLKVVLERLAPAPVAAAKVRAPAPSKKARLAKSAPAPKPASKLDEDDEPAHPGTHPPAPSRDDLKRPSPQ